MTAARSLRLDAPSRGDVYEFVFYGHPVSQKNSRELVKMKDGQMRSFPNKIVEAWHGPVIGKRTRKPDGAIRTFRKQWAPRKPIPRKTPCKVQIIAYHTPRRRPDIDNIPAAPLDALQKAGVVENDSCFDELHVIRRRVKDEREARVVVRVWVQSTRKG